MKIKYSKNQINNFPKEVIWGACVEVNDENMEQILNREDIGNNELRGMVNLLRKCLKTAKIEAKHWGQECYKVKGDLIKLKDLRQKEKMARDFDQLIEEASE